MRDLFGLKNKVALITGGSKGIGLASAELLSELGAKVTITGRDKAALSKAEKALNGEVLAIPGDVSNAQDILTWVNETVKHFGNIDIVFANAGVGGRLNLDEITEDVFAKMVNINYRGVYFTIQKAYPHMNKQGAVIINASISGMLSTARNNSLYSSTKAALIQLARSLANEFSPKGIRVNSISPGLTQTEIWHNKSMLPMLATKVPLGARFATALEIANVVGFLASDMASYITGQNIVVDGGLSSMIPLFPN